MLSQTAEYALRAVLHLAEHDEHHLTRVSEMSETLGIPRNYLSKILHLLTCRGVLVSSRGKSGGFRLATAAQHLYLVDVVAPFGRFDEERHCLLGRPQCSDHAACAAHHRWKDVAERVASFFRETTVAELLHGAHIPA